MLVFGLALAAVGALLIAAFANSRVKCGSAAEAVVSKVEVKTMTLRGSSVKEYTPVFTYTVGGKTYTAKADLSTRVKERFAAGQKQTVFVNPNRPEEMRFGNQTGFLLAGLVFAAAGLLVIVLSLT